MCGEQVIAPLFVSSRSRVRPREPVPGCPTAVFPCAGGSAIQGAESRGRVGLVLVSAAAGALRKSQSAESKSRMPSFLDPYSGRPGGCPTHREAGTEGLETSP